MDRISANQKGEFLPLLTAKQAAERLGVSRAKVYRLMTTGELKSVPIGGNRRIEQAALHEFIDVQKANDRAA